MAGLDAFLRAQDLSATDLRANRAGTLSQDQLVAQQKNGRAGLRILVILMILIGAIAPAGFTAYVGTADHGLLEAIWIPCAGIALVVLGPIAMLQVWFLRRVAVKTVISFDGAITQSGYRRPGMPYLELGGKRWHLDQRLFERIMAIVEPGQQLRLYAVPGSFGIVAIEPLPGSAPTRASE